MKNKNDLFWYIIIASILIIISFISYSIEITLFHREYETYFYFLQDISFVPIQALIVTFLIDRLLRRQEKIIIYKRVNVAIGIFFSEIGNNFLKYFNKYIANNKQLEEIMSVEPLWRKKEFENAQKQLKGFRLSLDIPPDKIKSFKEDIDKHRFFILELLENPNLSEHDSFTDSLLAISHLSDELFLRSDITNLPSADLNHLYNDISRAYHGIAMEWLLYMSHIKKEYPFLFSLALRTNPFNDQSSIIIQE